MIEAKSYLGSVTVDGGPRFVSLDEFNGSISKPRHIDGAIELTVDGSPLITLAMWDLLDQLWVYLLLGAEKVAAGQSYHSRFPDSPTSIVFTPSVDGMQVEAIIGENRVYTALKPFVLGIAQSAIMCLERLSQLLGRPEWYAEEIAKAKRLIITQNESISII